MAYRLFYWPRRGRGSGIGAKLALGCLSTLFGLLAVEGLGRLLWGLDVRVEDRVLFFSRDTWNPDAAGAMRYSPNREIRTTALYGTGVEYDVRFSTNDLGFIDTRDYVPLRVEGNDHGLAIVGDSFTAGFHGGDPWVPRLAARVRRAEPGYDVFNLGVGATGIGDFRRLLNSVRDEIAFDRVAVVLISNDVMRPQWRPVEHEGRLHLCRVDGDRAKCLSSGSRILILEDDDESEAELIGRAEQSGLVVGFSHPLRWFARRTFIGSRLRSLLRPPAAQATALENPIVQGRVRTFVSGLRRDFPEREIRILHLPMKQELKDRQLAIDLAPHAAGAEIQYDSLLGRCGLTLADYHEFDSHPNARGYDKILDCVAEVLGLP